MIDRLPICNLEVSHFRKPFNFRLLRSPAHRSAAIRVSGASGPAARSSPASARRRPASAASTWERCRLNKFTTRGRAGSFFNLITCTDLYFYQHFQHIFWKLCMFPQRFIEWCNHNVTLINSQTFERITFKISNLNTGQHRRLVRGWASVLNAGRAGSPPQ